MAKAKRTKGAPAIITTKVAVIKNLPKHQQIVKHKVNKKALKAKQAELYDKIWGHKAAIRALEDQQAEINSQQLSVDILPYVGKYLQIPPNRSGYARSGIDFFMYVRDAQDGLVHFDGFREAGRYGDFVYKRNQEEELKKITRRPLHPRMIITREQYLNALKQQFDLLAENAKLNYK